jgi:hypothetical protein
MFYSNTNELNRQTWLKKTLAALPAGSRILDAGAGELKSRKYCGHLNYVSQDFCQYKGLRGEQLMKAYKLKVVILKTLLISSVTSLRFLLRMLVLMQFFVAKCWNI